MTGRMMQRHKHFPGVPAHFADVILHNGVAALKAILGAEPFKDEQLDRLTDGRGASLTDQVREAMGFSPGARLRPVSFQASGLGYRGEAPRYVFGGTP